MEGGKRGGEGGPWAGRGSIFLGWRRQGLDPLFVVGIVRATEEDGCPTRGTR